MQPLDSEALDRLIKLLSLERIEEDLFRGQSQDLGWGTVFGGQVLGQALSAAAQTTSEDLSVHSMHGYFLRPGRVDMPIVYEVDRIRDGRSFATRRVVAIQKGKAIFNLSASFQVQEDGFSHQDTMPEVRGPDGLKNERELVADILDQIPALLRDRIQNARPIEIRPISPNNPLQPEIRKPHRDVWYRAACPLPDDPALHRYLLAYASDFYFLGATLDPHGVSWMTTSMKVASIDHAMWFHRPFRMDEWLLYVIDSPSASGSRGLVRGQFFNREGLLVASTMQEGLIRRRTKKTKAL